MEKGVKFTEYGKQMLHELHIDNQHAIKDALKELSEDLRLGKPLTGRLEGLFSLKVRKRYRVVYSVLGETIVVIAVGHRRDIYQKAEQIMSEVA